MIYKTPRFESGRINYNIMYWQFQMPVTQEDGTVKLELYHCEQVKYWQFPFTLMTKVQCEPCTNTAEYYRQ